jgi:arylsulfatase A-like enzyme
LPIRSGTSKVPTPGKPQGLVPWEYTLAELLLDAGYQSAMYGKWHPGDKEGRYATNQGFDEWYGFPHRDQTAKLPRSPPRLLLELDEG